MSAHQHEWRAGQAPGFRALRWNMDWILRPVFGIALAIIAILALFHGPRTFALLTSAIGIAAAFEWHRLVSMGKPYRIEAALSGAALTVACVALSMKAPLLVSLAAIALGVAAAAAVAGRREGDPLWHGLGVLYVSLPCLALVALRTFLPSNDSRWVVVGLFLIVWGTDTGALVFGNLIGGPRLAPVLSPGKTWSGTIGGSLTGAFVFAMLIGLLGGAVELAFLFALLFSFVAHAGDLFESFVKRHFGFKDSGGLIPGHGGVLDRMDSTMAAAPAMAILIFLFNFHPLIGVHP